MEASCGWKAYTRRRHTTPKKPAIMGARIAALAFLNGTKVQTGDWCPGQQSYVASILKLSHQRVKRVALLIARYAITHMYALASSDWPAKLASKQIRALLKKQSCKCRAFLLYNLAITGEQCFKIWPCRKEVLASAKPSIVLKTTSKPAQEVDSPNQFKGPYLQGEKGAQRGSMMSGEQQSSLTSSVALHCIGVIQSGLNSRHQTGRHGSGSSTHTRPHKGGCASTAQLPRRNRNADSFKVECAYVCRKERDREAWGCLALWLGFGVQHQGEQDPGTSGLCCDNSITEELVCQLFHAMHNQAGHNSQAWERASSFCFFDCFRDAESTITTTPLWVQSVVTLTAGQAS